MWQREVFLNAPGVVDINVVVGSTDVVVGSTVVVVCSVVVVFSVVVVITVYYAVNKPTMIIVILMLKVHAL